MSKLFTPNSGKEVLPDEVQQMLSLLHENLITEYRLSSLFEQDPLIYQRTIESAWPAKKEEKSKYLLRAIEEIESPIGCTEVDRRKDVILVHCP